MCMSWGNPQVVLNELSQRLNGNGWETFVPHLRYSPTFKDGKLKGYIEPAPSLVMVI